MFARPPVSRPCFRLNGVRRRPTENQEIIIAPTLATPALIIPDTAVPSAICSPAGGRGAPPRISTEAARNASRLSGRGLTTPQTPQAPPPDAGTLGFRARQPQSACTSVISVNLPLHCRRDSRSWWAGSDSIVGFICHPIQPSAAGGVHCFRLLSRECHRLFSWSCSAFASAPLEAATLVSKEEVL